MTTSVSMERIEGMPPPPSSFNGNTTGYNVQGGQHGGGGSSVKFAKRKQSLAGKRLVSLQHTRYFTFPSLQSPLFHAKKTRVKSHYVVTFLFFNRRVHPRRNTFDYSSRHFRVIHSMPGKHESLVITDTQSLAFLCKKISVAAWFYDMFPLTLFSLPSLDCFIFLMTAYSLRNMYVHVHLQNSSS